MAKLKSARHHWWPETVSEHWKDPSGRTHWLLPDGEVRTSPPKNFGLIGNGHHIKMSSDPSVETVWDTCFEPEFERADNAFPSVIAWLQGLSREHHPDAASLTERFMAQPVPEDRLAQLAEGLASLAVRSPMNREASVSMAERLRGPLPERERNRIIGGNMHYAMRNAMQSIGTRGRFAVIYSPHREFIYGDGFFHNILSPAYNLRRPEILVPVTPEITVLFAVPPQYTPPAPPRDPGSHCRGDRPSQ